MTRSPRPSRPLDRWLGLLLLAGVVVLGACSTEAPPAASTDGPTATTSVPSTTALVLENPADGEVITVSVGDRIQVPVVDGPGGIVLGGREGQAAVDGLLVRETEDQEFGDAGTYRAVGPGEVTITDSVYDPERSCVPPKVVATFTLVIVDDASTSTEGATIADPAPHALRSAASAAPSVRSVVAAPTCVGD